MNRESSTPDRADQGSSRYRSGDDPDPGTGLVRDSLVEYFPHEHPGLSWEATDAPDDAGDVFGFVLAELHEGRVAVANVNNQNNVLIGTIGELVALKEALADGRFDFLLPPGHRRPPD
ncbi:hypothetical protein [Kitasatospora sp. MAP5-34]|uniref:hypothetical protein n=1 Tax=Kitasatospora sp. MAP5-34 TaxID=3035102 RepID=UPI0024761948|nr:hypothetical protein [Kitasatospora sp. MAP5-34]MDH6577510.1 hypothetical protein [Kitasatospora sp. MAP5-34]